jgi:(E)-4-hydroxy-3-methylbut-2-enyl-diphosphate synthase
MKAGATIVQSAIENVRLLERFDFHDIVVSVKSSRVDETIKAYRELAEVVEYPLHLGVTEAGTMRMGIIKSAIGIGSLLCEGIGDTIRVSLTADPVKEVGAAIDILKSIGKRKGVEIVSCPTCGRCKIDVESLSNELDEQSRNFNRPIKLAVMGCAVNGPGECKDADYGITGGDGEGLIFRRGKIVKKVEESQLIPELIKEIKDS